MEQASPMAKFVTTRQPGSVSMSQDTFNKLTLRFVVLGVHPLSIIERPEFRLYPCVGTWKAAAVKEDTSEDGRRCVCTCAQKPLQYSLPARTRSNNN